MGTVTSHVCVPTERQPVYLPSEIQGPWDPNFGCNNLSFQYDTNGCIDSFEDLTCALSRGDYDLKACPGAKIEWPFDDARVGGTNISPKYARESAVVVVPDKFKLKCPTCDCMLEREWITIVPSRGDGVVPACPFFQTELGNEITIEGFKWESELLFGLIDVDANYNIITTTAYDTDLRYVSGKDKSQAKISKKCKNEGSISSSTSTKRSISGSSSRPSKRDLGDLKDRESGTRGNTGGTRGNKPRGLQYANDYDIGVVDGAYGGDTCAFFDDPNLVEVPSEESNGIAATTTTDGGHSREGCVSDSDLQNWFDEMDTDEDQLVVCEDVPIALLTELNSTCENFKSFFGKEAVNSTELKAVFDGVICE
mmetsp:Transcript_17173/g.31084  ORF Transcript_17173/g.31084 Transcript_17173/m.31084 type:complete len:367 (-) Transcript_17173:138-1238(-)|eukprot:CAMPEP_0202495416 /NCGR_PEP_ID=MMETSP1361-20130828/16357_1 /ASSEMBLY_ACC=CAM_ASM_000849 /TAXON_ID=210615 /ORGANISM="Staurosira complex sp., Strain CCMP2646" /LENGTH=366 /DNA_ID=CAMNT_0049126417 /DNA_START=30 /DNA_END=1130 /DNA_ORIENTATION=+